MKYARGIVLLLCLFMGTGKLLAQSCSSVDFSISVKKGCSPLVIKFTALNAPAGSTFSWDFGSGATIGQDTIYKAFTVSGKYKVILKVITPTGSTCTIIKDSVEVLPAPTPNISVAPGRFLCKGPQQVTFTDNTADIVDREWIIDGVTYGNSATVTHTFTTSGFKSLSLKMVNSYGCTTLFSDNKFLSINDSAFTDFCGDVTISDTGYRVKFTPNVTNLGTRTVTKYEWSFPGGIPSSYTGKTPASVLFKDPKKSFDVTLKVTLSDGCRYTVYRKNYLMPYIVADKDTLCLGKKVLVTNKGSGDNGKNYFQINFPDGAAMPKPPSQNFEVEYNKAGAYGANLSFKYSVNGCSTTVKYLRYISVLGPKVDFDADEKTGCDASKKIKLINRTDTFGAVNVFYTWRIYDEFDKPITKWVFGPTTKPDTAFFPGQSGKFGVSLTAKSSNGCKDSVFKSQFINISSPTATFETDSQEVCLGSSIAFFSHPDPVEEDGKVGYSYTWNLQHTTIKQIFTTIIGKSPTWRPEVPGKYDVTLIIKNGKCGDTIVKKSYLTVNGVMGDFISDKKGGCAGTAILFTGKVSGKYPSTSQNTLKYLWQVSGADDDAYTIIDKNALSTYIVFWNSGCYDVILNFIDTKKCTTQVIKERYVCLGVNAQFSLPRNKCIGDTSDIDVFASKDAETYKWSVFPPEHAEFFPSDTIRSPRIIYKKDTCYTVKLIATKKIEGYECVDTFTREKCMILPTAGFKSNDTSLYCAPVVASFDNLSTNAQKFLWDFGDGGIVFNDDATKASHVYARNNQSGWTVKLTAMDTFGCQQVFVKKNYIKITGPEPKFSVSRRTGCDEVTVAFENKSINITKFNLIYNDGTGADTNDYSVHKYRLDDITKDSITYFPILIAQDKKGCPAFYQDTITVYRSPKAAFFADTVLACVPYMATFHDATTGAVGKRYWDFNNDGIYDDSVQNPTFYYDTPGKYTVKLLVLGKGGCLDSAIYENYMNIQAIPVAGFVSDKKKFCGKEWVSFADSNHSYVYYLFDYGDGSEIETNTIPDHVYAFTEGKDSGDSIIYVPKVIAYNNAGCTDTFTDTIIVYANPVTGFKASITSGCSPLQVVFTDTGKHVKQSYWDFENDGIIDDSGAVVTHAFSPGLYTVKLKNASGFGCVDSLVKVNFINVNEPPTADYVVSDTGVCVGGTVQFTDISQPKSNIIKWKWFFDETASGGADTSTLQNPLFKYFTPGYHTVTLVAEDNKGCTDTISKKTIYVEDTLPPANSKIYAVSVNENGGVDVSWSSNKIYDFAEYQLFRESPVDQQIAGLNHFSDTSYMDNDAALNTQAQSYCYYIKTRDKCGNISAENGTSHCTILLDALAISSTKTRISWSSYIGWNSVKEYRIFRAGGNNIYTHIATLPGDSLLFNDSDLCSETYCYYVLAIHPNGKLVSRSNTKCVKPPYEFQNVPLTLQYATVTGNKNIKLKWEAGSQENLENYIIDRYSAKNGLQKSYAFSTDTTYVDYAVDVFSQSYIYAVRTQDACGYLGPESNIATSIRLRNKVNNDKITLYWNRYNFWKNGVSRYEIQVRKRNGDFVTVGSVGAADSVFTDDSVYTEIDTSYCYRVVAIENGTYKSVSNTSCAILVPRILAPNAFTPNKDSLNEEWKPIALFIYNKTGTYKDYQLKIFDRWGALIFESTDINKGWNGSRNGTALPAGVYIYTVEAEGLDGHNIYLKGNISLIK